MPYTPCQIRSNPIIKRFQRIVWRALDASKKRKALWNRLYKYVRCVKIASIEPRQRSGRQCRELSDWIWSNLSGNHILSRVHWEDRARVSKYILLIKTPQNTVVSLQNQEPDAFKILLGGICSEWQQSQKGRNVVLEKIKQNEQSETTRTPRETTTDDSVPPVTPLNTLNPNKRMIAPKTMPNKAKRSRKKRKFICKSPQRVYHRQKSCNKDAAAQDIEKNIAPLLQLPASQLRSVSMLPGEHNDIIKQVLADMNANNEIESTQNKQQTAVDPSPNKSLRSRGLGSKPGTASNNSRPMSPNRCNSRKRRYSLVSKVPPTAMVTPQRPLSKNENLLNPARLSDRQNVRRRRASMVGQTVQIQEKILSKFMETGKENQQRRSIFGHDTVNIQEKELKLQYQKEEEKTQDKHIVDSRDSLSYFMVKTMGKRINTLSPGDSFDSLILFSDEVKSTSSIITECECEFLYLTAKDLNKVLKLNNRHRLRTKVLSLEAVPIFQKLNYASRLRLSNISKIRTYLDGDVVPLYEVENSKKRSLCYWILSGKCAITTGNKRKSKLLVRRNCGSIINEYGLLQCSKQSYQEYIDTDTNDNSALIADLHKKLKIKCIGKCDFIRFYWDEFLLTLDKIQRGKILKLVRNHINQLLYYMDFTRLQNNHNAKLLKSAPVKAVAPRKLQKSMSVAHIASASASKRVFDFEPQNIRKSDYRKLNKLTKSVSTTNLLLPQHHNTNIKNRTFQKLSSSISFSNLLSPQTLVEYVDEFNTKFNYKQKDDAVSSMDNDDLLLTKQPTPRTLTRVASGKQNMRSVFIKCADKLIIPHNIQTHLNRTCINKRNRNRKFQTCSTNNANLLLRNFSTGTLNVFF
eukprot:107846_1